MSLDLPTGPLDRALAPVLARIRQDRAKADPRVKCVFTLLEEKMLKKGLDAKRVWLETDIKSHAVRGLFPECAGMTLAQYIRAGRVGAATSLLLHTELKCKDVGGMVGYLHYPPFIRAIRKVYEDDTKTPLTVRQTGPEAAYYFGPREEPPEPSRALRHERDQADVSAARPQPEVLRQAPAPTVQPAGEICLDLGGGRRYTIADDPALHEELYALGLWAKICDLPYGAQCRLVSSCTYFHQPDFFELLRKMARVEGRKDRRRGIELAELGVLSLKGDEKKFGTAVYDKMALGLAEVGNQHRLAGDLAAAMAAFEKSDRAWSDPRAPHDPVVAAELALHKAALRISMSRFEEALELVDVACVLYQRAGDVKGEVQSLILRAAILGYCRRSKDAIATLLEAQALDPKEDRELLAYAVASNLSIDYVETGQYSAAEQQLKRANRHLIAGELQDRRHELRYFEAFLKHRRGDRTGAMGLYAKARDGFIGAGAMAWLPRVNLDLALLYSEQGEWTKVRELASEAAALLEPLRLSSETLAAVELLTEALPAEKIPRKVLQELRERLLRDPLIHQA